MFAVVVCPRCRTAKGVNLNNKTVMCRCGKRLRIQELKIYQRASNYKELVDAVGKVNAYLRGAIKEYKDFFPTKSKPRDVYSRIASMARNARDRKEKIRVAVVELSKEFDLFSYEDLGKVLDKMGINGVERCLEDLLKENVIYEPRIGLYKMV